MSKPILFFRRDGEYRNLAKPMLEFLKPVPTSSRKYNYFEQNHHRFFQVLGTDFSQNQILTPSTSPAILERIAEIEEQLKKEKLALEGQCHYVAHLLHVDLESLTKMVFGYVDCYDGDNYSGTYSHSFLIDKETSGIIDPFFIKRMQSGSNESHRNHFGVIIPMDIDYALSYLGKSINSPYGGTGILKSYIFKDKRRTKVTIEEIKKHY